MASKRLNQTNPVCASWTISSYITSKTNHFLHLPHPGPMSHKARDRYASSPPPIPNTCPSLPLLLETIHSRIFCTRSFRTKPINKPLLHRCLLFYTTSLSASLPVSSNRPPPLKTKNLYLYFKSDKSTNHPLSDFHAQQKSRAEFLSSRLSDDMHISKSNHLPLAQESPTNRFLPLPKLLDRIDEIVV